MKWENTCLLKLELLKKLDGIRTAILLEPISCTSGLVHTKINLDGKVILNLLIYPLGICLSVGEKVLFTY